MENIERTVSFLKLHPAVKFSTFIAGVILSLLTFYVLMEDIRQPLDHAGGFFVFLIALLLCGSVTGAFIVAYIISERSWRKYSEALMLEKEKLVVAQMPDDSRQRFEEIQNTPVRLGWVPFYPTLAVDNGGRKSGAGPEILNTVFDGNIRFCRRRSSWSNVFQDLIRGEFDVIATPLYDIKERRAHVEFTTPIFYADIGIFAASSNEKIKRALAGRNKLDFEPAMRTLQPIAETLRFCVHRGELQDKLVAKYFIGSKVREAHIEEFSIAAALEAMVDCDDEYSSDLYFCERVQGEEHWLYREGKLFNLLNPGQLLFPVAFAIRRGEETLRKYINLRLMTMDGDRRNGIREHLICYSAGIVSDALIKKADEYFLRQRGAVRSIKGQEESRVQPLTG